MCPTRTRVGEVSADVPLCGYESVVEAGFSREGPLRGHEQARCRQAGVGGTGIADRGRLCRGLADVGNKGRSSPSAFHREGRSGQRSSAGDYSCSLLTAVEEECAPP